MSYRGNRGNKVGPRRNMGGNRSGGWNNDNRDSLPSTRFVNASNWRAATPNPTPNPTPNSVPESSSSTITSSSSSPKPVPTSTSTTTTTWAAIATAQPPRPSPQRSESIDTNTSSSNNTTAPVSQPDTTKSSTTAIPTSSKPVAPHMPSTSAWANGPPVSVKSRKTNSPTTSTTSTPNHTVKKDNKEPSSSSSSSIVSSSTTNQDPSPTTETNYPTQPEKSESPAPPASFLTASTTGVSSSWAIDDDMDDVEPLPEWFTKPPKTEVGTQEEAPVNVTSSSVSNRSTGVSQKVLQGFIKEANKREIKDSTIQNCVKRGDSRSPTQSTVKNEPFCAPEAAQVLARRVTMAQEEAESNVINSVYQPPVEIPQLPSIGMLYDGKTSFISELNKLL